MEKQAKILLVDDDPDFVKATSIILRSKPYHVITALGGNEGLSKAREERPDLIILDIIMPDKDGFAVCQELKQDPQFAKVPILMLTAFSEKFFDTTLALTQGLMLEADDFAEKSVTPTELLLRVERLLRKVGF